VSFSLDTSIPFHSDRFISLHQSNGRCATNKYFQIIGSIHDIESYFGIDNTVVVNVQIYNWLYTLGFNSVFHLYNFVIICELLAVISIPLGKVHLIYLEDTLQWCYIVGFTLNLELEIIHLHKKLALDILSQPIFIWPWPLIMQLGFITHFLRLEPDRFLFLLVIGQHKC
jgi:hypothetical protein